MRKCIVNFIHFDKKVSAVKRCILAKLTLSILTKNCETENEKKLRKSSLAKLNFFDKQHSAAKQKMQS